MAELYRKKKKVCYMCSTGKDINYKDILIYTLICFIFLVIGVTK